MRGILFVLVLGVLAAGAALLWPRFEAEPPTLAGPERIELGKAPQVLQLTWADAGMGLREVSALLEFDAGETTTPQEPKELSLHSKRFPGNALSGPLRPSQAQEEAISIDLDAKALELAEGEATLVLRARDWSLSGWGSGNPAELRIPVRIDTTAPALSVTSGLTYIRRGGAAAVVYQIDQDARQSGVRIAEAWFPGAPFISEEGSAQGSHIAVFAIPIDAPDDPQVEVVAIDAVGNEATAHFDVRVRERSFAKTSIALSERFLKTVGTRLGKSSSMTEATPLATFQRINSELRAKNEATITEAIPLPTPKQWTGAFEQMHNSSVTSKFAELRHYKSNGEQVSIARHYGFDLASTARAPITASNSGNILYAGENGIYGNLVIIDHGLGISSLYGHLSSIDVKVGDRVEKGETLGQSGATGLAGGDHLHFAILVGKSYVDPVEWWDPKWVREHIEDRLPKSSS